MVAEIKQRESITLELEVGRSGEIYHAPKRATRVALLAQLPAREFFDISHLNSRSFRRIYSFVQFPLTPI